MTCQGKPDIYVRLRLKHWYRRSVVAPTLLSNHGLALLCIARQPAIRLRDLAECLDVTERTAQRLLSELVSAGYVTKRREGARNRYELNDDAALADPGLGHLCVDDLAQLTAERTTSGYAPRERRSGERRRSA
ncbi:MAG: hypothetical protein NVSMB51_18350 [Solirubrobacteraceae bacterium]